MDLHDKITNKLEEACAKNEWGLLYLDEYIASAAIKGSVLFQAIGYEYGDKTPSVYKIEDIIRKLFISIGTNIARNEKDDNYNDVSCSTGMFTARAYYEEWDDFGQWQFEIYFDLLNFAEHRILIKE